MKATFVFPPIPYKFAKTPYPPLGIGYLAAVLRMQDVQIDLIDGQIIKEGQFWHEIENLTTDVVLISATIRQIKAAKLVAKIVKKHDPATAVILGGPGPSALAVQQRDFIKDTEIDIVVKGEAENLLPLILRRLEADESLNDVPNLIINKDGNVISTRIVSVLPDVRTIPWPDRTIFDEKAYLARWLNSAKMTSIHIMGSRGCPFSCSFCDRTVTGRRMRYRDVEDVAAEMLFLEKRYSPDDIFYFDDIFTVNKKRVIALCQTLQNKGLQTSWSAQGHVDTIDKEMLEAMKAAGCAELMLGVESGSERILQFLGKGFTREKIIKAFDLCHRVGIKPGAYLIVGVPGETRQDIMDTVSLVERIEPSLLNFSFLTPFPNTSLYTATQHWIGNWDYEVKFRGSQLLTTIVGLFIINIGWNRMVLLCQAPLNPQFSRKEVMPWTSGFLSSGWLCSQLHSATSTVATAIFRIAIIIAKCRLSSRKEWLKESPSLITSLRLSGTAENP